MDGNVLQHVGQTGAHLSGDGGSFCPSEGHGCLPDLRLRARGSPPGRFAGRATARHADERLSALRAVLQVQWYDAGSAAWIDIQKAHATPAAAQAACPTGKTCRVVEIAERSRRPLPT